MPLLVFAIICFSVSTVLNNIQLYDLNKRLTKIEEKVK